jgi:hypothetical protein
MATACGVVTAGGVVAVTGMIAMSGRHLRRMSMGIGRGVLCLRRWVVG